MTVTRTKKNETLASLVENFKKSKSLAFFATNKVVVSEISALRKDVLKGKAQVFVAKKTLIALAFKKVFELELPETALAGQLAVVVAFDDALAGMNKANKHVAEVKGEDKKNKIVWTGAFFDGKILNAAETAAIAGLPGREALLSRLLGSLKSPLGAFVRMVDALAKKKAEGAPVVAAAAPAPVEAAAAVAPVEAPAAPAAPAAA